MRIKLCGYTITISIQCNMTNEVLVPQLGESITKATVAKIHKNIGDKIVADDVVFELETDKVTFAIPSPVNGVVDSVKVNVGDEISVGAVLAVIEEEYVESFIKRKSAELWDKRDAPSAQKLMSENNLNKDEVLATGKGNRITKNDVKNHIENKKSTTKNQDQAEIAGAIQGEERQAQGSVRYVRMSKLRQKIAERLKESQNTAAILTTFNEIDMKNVMDLRAKYKDQFQKKYSIKLGFMSFFAKAVVTALQEIPEINAEISDDQIIYKSYYDIGVAVGTEQGLVVPVIRDIDRLSIAQIESEISRLSLKARDGQLSLKEMQGGTFTISNGGVYGSLFSTPIINPPQSGILGMHSIQKRPVVVDDKIEIRPMMYIALSYDHRIVDGKGAVMFLVKLKQCIEDPYRLMLEV